MHCDEIVHNGVCIDLVVFLRCSHNTPLLYFK